MAFGFQVSARHRGPRLAYVLDVLCERYGWSWAYGDGGGADAVSPSRRPLLVYGDRGGGSDLKGAPLAEPVVKIRAHGLLSAPSGATAADVRWGLIDGVPCPTGEDPLAGCFYCLALLGEYADRAADAHGRLPAATHPLYLAGAACVPIADRLFAAVANRLWAAGGQVGVPRPLAEPAAATSDVDAPRALAGKPPARRLSALGRGLYSVWRGGGGRALPGRARLTDYWCGRADPFDTFGYLHAAAATRGLAEDVFTLVGYGTRLDPGWRFGHGAWERFWRKLPPETRLGIHPSYYSSERPELFRREIDHLRAVSGRPVTVSRQHFLRLRLPGTFRALVDCGIREDHTLMWADAEGFRAGTARSFLWYDVHREERTALRLFPPHAMDVTARYYGGLSPKLAIASWTNLAREAHASGTGFRCIWHNSNLGPWYGWTPWRVAFEASLDLSVIR